MRNTDTSLTDHLVFSTRQRLSLIRREMQADLHRYIAGILRDNRSQAIEIGGVEDHVHIVTGITPAVAVADMARLIKSNSSKWFNEKRSRNVRFGWQTGYAGFTVSQSQAGIVREYVCSRREHRRTRSLTIH